MPTKGFATADLLRQHYLDHRDEFGCTSAAQYLALAETFLGGRLAADAAECTRRDGCLVRYNATTGELGVRHSDGYIATYFRKGTSQWARGYFCVNCKK